MENWIKWICIIAGLLRYLFNEAIETWNHDYLPQTLNDRKIHHNEMM